MHGSTAGVAGVLLLAFHLNAGTAEPPGSAGVSRSPQQKMGWEWTLEERLAMRTDPVKIAERARETAQNYSIDGSRNPELLLPHELFQSLLTGFVPDDDRRRRKRESLRAGIIASGFAEELFWAQLRSAASEYIDTYAYPAPGAVVSLADRRNYGLCRTAFDALQNARQVFGRERFDRFLYEVVAPRVWVASATNAPDPAAELRYVEEGCR